MSQQLVTEIVKPQAAYTHQALKDLIEDVTQSSMMRLDAKSMDKLWDLITMVFKWQITLSEDLLKLTQRHLYEIENYVTHEATQLQLHKVQNVFDNFTKILSSSEITELRDATLNWLKDFHVRVSLLLRIGLQDNEGRFVVDNLDPFAEDMLRNLGENIYSVTQNGKLLRDDENERDMDEEEPKDTNRNEALELEMLAGQLKGSSTAGNITSNVLKLSINYKDNRSANHFDSIATRTDNSVGDNNNGSAGRLEDMFEDLQLTGAPNDNDNDNFNEDLINMIENSAN